MEVVDAGNATDRLSADAHRETVLQVEEEVASWWFLSEQRTRRRWRVATVMDLAQPQMRPLMDLRNGPTFLPRAAVTEGIGVLPSRRVGA